MSIYDKIDKLKKVAISREAQRIIAELRFACEMSKAASGKFDELITIATEALYQAYERQGAITIEDAQKCEQQLMPLANEAKSYTLHCVAHAHIDMNWKFGFNETVAITLETFRTMLRLMDEYPRFTFSQSQISVYNIVEEYDPAMFKEIQRRVAEGRWEIAASTWVEGDKNMPDGESLTRHYLYSKKYLREKFNLDKDAMLLDFEPDTFGHNANMPEILANADVRYYYHCRGYSNHVIYRWRSQSGAEALVYREPLWYNSGIDADVFEYVPSLAKQIGCRDILKVYGVGDHGGGPTRRDINMLQNIESWPIAPNIVFSSYHTYFKKIESFRHSFPVVNGELNFVFTGCFSSQSKIKMANHIAEDRINQAECLSALANSFADGECYTSEFEQAWRRIMFNQFHDILPGSCIVDTREYAMGLFQQAMGYVHSGTMKALSSFAQQIDTSDILADRDTLYDTALGAGVGFKADMDSGYSHQTPGSVEGETRIFHLFNTTAYPRHGASEITVWDWQADASIMQFTTPDGSILKHQILEEGNYWGHSFIRVMVKNDVPAFGYQTVLLNRRSYDRLTIAGNHASRTNSPLKNVLENKYIRAEFDFVNMTLISLVDKRTGRQLVQSGACSFDFQYCSAKGGMLSAWNDGVIGNHLNLNCTQQVCVTQRMLGSDQLSQWIIYKIRFKNSSFDVRVQLDDESSFLRYIINCDWHEISTGEEQIPTLRFAVPVGYSVQSYRYEIPFGVIERNDMNNDVSSRSFVYAVNDEHKQGVMVMANSLYAYRGEDNCINVTLIRASRNPDPYPEYGMHRFEIGVGVCDCDIDEQYRMTSSFLHPIQLITNHVHGGKLPLTSQLLDVQGGVQVSAIKLPESHESGMIIRLYNPTKDAVKSRLVFALPINSVFITDGLENNSEKLVPEKNTVTIPVKPYGVQAVKVELASS